MRPRKKQAVDFPPVEAPDDEEVKAVFAAVEAARADLAAEDETGDDFTILARGGPSTMAAHGVAVDSYRAAAQRGTPSEWIALFFRHGHRSMTVSIARYGARCCVLLCKIWCSMMQHFYNEYIESGFNDDVVFSVYDAEVALPIAFGDLMSLPEGHDVRVRPGEIILMRPVFA